MNLQQVTGHDISFHVTMQFIDCFTLRCHEISFNIVIIASYILLFETMDIETIFERYLRIDYCDEWHVY